MLLPSDHFIKNNSNFLRVISFASKFLLEINQIILFGIKPDSAHTGYGYIELGEAHHTSGDFQPFQIKVFKEKPTKKNDCS